MSLRLYGIEHLSPSGASTLQQCERRYWWRYHEKLGKDERSEALATGNGLAHALEFGDLDRGLAVYEESRPPADGWTDMVAYQRDAVVARATIANAYAGYTARYPDPGLIREQTYLIALENGGTGRVIQARVDGCVPDQYLVEDKLRRGSSMQAEDLENEVRQGKQLTAEIWAHWKATKELLPVRFRVTKKIDPRKPKGTKDKRPTPDEIVEMVAEHFATDGVFNEFTATRTEDQLAEFEAEFTDMALRADVILASPTPAGVRNTDACHAYGRTCPALAACQGMQPWTNLTNQED
jgi:hypothetical protein